MTVDGADVTRTLGNAPYVKEEPARGLSFPGIFAQMAPACLERHRHDSATLAPIAAMNHVNDVHNPWVQLRKNLGFGFCDTVLEKNSVIAAPLRRTDRPLVSDGACAVILVESRLAARHPRAVSLCARAQLTEDLPESRRHAVLSEGPRPAWARALADARCTLGDLSLAEVNDCITIAGLPACEPMGQAPPGKGARPLGATGVSVHVLAATQWVGEAGDMQVPGAERVDVFNVGGSAAASNVCTLERQR